MTTITSTANARVKELRRIVRRRGDGCFAVESYRLIRQALDGGVRLRALYAAPALFAGGGEWELLARARVLGVPVHELGGAAFASISRQSTPEGLLALVERPPLELERLAPGAEPLLLVAEGVERPGNLGTIVRTACAAGASALVACDAQTDVFHPKAIAASVGAAFRLPLAVASSADTVRWLRLQRVRIVVATPEGTRPVWELDLRGAVALVVGSEKRGVTCRWLEAADQLASIPMPGPAMDSLNVAAAAAIALFEAVRQRSGQSTLLSE